MAKKFGKTITTPEQLELYQECNRLWDEYQQAEKQKSENFLIYCQMEGKYAIDTVEDSYAGQGFRGYDYKYPNPEALAKERAERDTYYKENVKPWDERKKELLKKYDEAIKCYDQGIALKPGDYSEGRLTWLKAYALEKLGDKAAALECFKKASEYKGDAYFQRDSVKAVKRLSK